MAIARELAYAHVDDLYLDPTNPRLGRHNTGRDLTQAQVLDQMQGWDLEELAVSFVQNGFWPQEAVIVCRESLYGQNGLVVLEGNRRVAALRTLQAAVRGEIRRRSWTQIVRNGVSEDLFEHVPYLLADNRTDVDVFLGFRHVTGIKPWKPAEKAQYIAYLIDERGYDYLSVAKAIGSRSDSVRRNYMSYRLLLQIDDSGVVPPEVVEDRFSVMFLALREAGVREFLGVDLDGDPVQALRPVPRGREERLAHFALWLFGDARRPPLFTDSRRVSDFGRVLKSEVATEYLLSSSNPDFETAVRRAGVDVDDLMQRIRNATDEVEGALSTIHLHRDDLEVQALMERFQKSAAELLTRFFPPRV